MAIRDLGSTPVIPTRRNEAAVACPDWIHVNRERVERLWGRLKEGRAVATRYEKTASSFLGVLHLAATMRIGCAIMASSNWSSVRDGSSRPSSL